MSTNLRTHMESIIESACRYGEIPNLNNFVYPDADLTCMDLIGVNLTSARLAGVNLAGADLTNANLAEANLIGANLTDAELSGTSFANARWDGLAVQGLPGGDVYLVPTPEGWLVKDGYGDWDMDLDEFRYAVNGYDSWREAFPYPFLAKDHYKALVTLFDAHVEQNPDTIMNLRKKWSNN